MWMAISSVLCDLTGLPENGHKILLRAEPDARCSGVLSTSPSQGPQLELPLAARHSWQYPSARLSYSLRSSSPLDCSCAAATAYDAIFKTLLIETV